MLYCNNIIRFPLLMKKNRITLALLLLLLSAPLSAASLKLFTSVLPIASLVSLVGGERVSVEALVTAGHDPVTYDPQPSQLQRLGEADLYFTSGLPFEKVWMGKIRALNPRMKIIDLRQNLPVDAEDGTDSDQHESHPHGHGHGHGHEGGDPHVWTSPANIDVILALIAEELTANDPHGADYYQGNLQAAQQRFRQVDRRAVEVLPVIESPYFLVFHPAWGYLASEYGLVQVVIEMDGKEPGPRRLAELIEMAGQKGIGKIFVQPQFDQRIAAVIADAIDAKLVVVDPLSDDLVQSLNDFLDAMQVLE
ncbi:metal ABC transporter solute-binding protein, Zn/Mn family [Solemya velum gill symbiont]|uniref:metal ABC transporter solute-binding protein, Zn/Mn family n=2 Tax=Solemya velum gill symbiont TaxID=2340 RepID=UPI00099764D0|nr:zinc ABC transporter substrate-binding protein [Solemya velum gill symbiont]